MMPSGYRFGATYVGSNMLSPQEAYPVLMADMDPSGGLQAHIIHAPTSRTRYKVEIFRNRTQVKSYRLPERHHVSFPGKTITFFLRK